MATVVITIRTGNAQMQAWGEIRDAVTTAVDRAADAYGEEYPPHESDTRAVYDINGNRVGGIAVIEDR